MSGSENTGAQTASPAGIDWPGVPSLRAAGARELLRQLDDSQWWAPEKLEAAQFRQLGNLLAHSYRTVPYYRDSLKVLDGLRRRELNAEVWSRVPVLDRAAVQQAGPDMFSRAVPKDHGSISEIRTSGSTGRPVQLQGTGVTRLFFNTLNLRYHIWQGRDFSGSVACIRNLSGAMKSSAARGRGQPWAPTMGPGRMVYFDITRPVREQIEWLGEVSPKYLLTFPSNLKEMLRLSAETGFKPDGLAGVATMSETLDPSTRQECRDVWDIPISDTYSTEEAGLIALQCPDHDHYHVQSEHINLEILGPDGQPCPPGSVGRIVLTDLHNFASPLIRYDIGDYGEAGAACACGRGLPVLARVLGRARNMLSLPSGDKAWPSFPEREMMAIAPIRQFQIVQNNLKSIEARFVVVRPLTGAEEEQLLRYLRKCLGGGFEIDLAYLPEIARGSGGKYEDFLSMVNGS
ncbi:MAG: phenylacetate--CoA ligase family protein [Rhodospirillaceae bacterium]|nr:phenylacetate--CoA ligase family protein [Rhodospirillaceae bacterium]MBT3885594.1 phenylacetate--CoA ligase family protein [Rhodospirillaceae bacterium]MBT4116079.1 phenylacetate--CoA ligase family protein [Rhodospirillaceae bacterium]MBT4674002.1 phenylacetate--CoA ligase family protein [Rhodospirillaceae bacterium]MBT4717963.1 phenylacetate--CoA ligase family protein [Rhodospirillaceae bacterium]